MAISNIVVGQELDETRFDLEVSLVVDYISAVDGLTDFYSKTDLVPFTAVAALGVRTILRGLALPPGTIHVAQELVAHQSVASGQRVSCRAKVTQASHRKDGTFLVLEFAINDDAGQPVLDILHNQYRIDLVLSLHFDANIQYFLIGRLSFLHPFHRQILLQLD